MHVDQCTIAIFFMLIRQHLHERPRPQGSWSSLCARYAFAQAGGDNRSERDARCLALWRVHLVARKRIQKPTIFWGNGHPFSRIKTLQTSHAPETLPLLSKDYSNHDFTWAAHMISADVEHLLNPAVVVLLMLNVGNGGIIQSVTIFIIIPFPHSQPKLAIHNHQEP